MSKRPFKRYSYYYYHHIEDGDRNDDDDRVIWMNEQNFRKYLTFKKDHNELLLFLLRQLVKEALHYEEIISGNADRLSHIQVKLDDLQAKVRYSRARAHSYLGRELLVFIFFGVLIFLFEMTLQAQEHEIFDLRPFFSSSIFKEANFVLDEARGVIRHPLTR